MKPLQISFSGGLTSAFMTAMLIIMYSGRRELHVLFANTGQEDDKTLRFVENCERHLFNHPVVWLEADVNPKSGQGTGHRVVSSETAARVAPRGGPFEDVIKKYGIPNTNFPMCTRELKQRPMESYVKSLGYKMKDVEVAVGIRADELDRVPPKEKRGHLIYPLADWGVTKADVHEFFEGWPYTLNLPEHRGNCVWCWKKSRRKHMTLAVESPELFAFPRNMERLYPHAGAGDGPRTFFRGRATVDDIFEQARQPFNPFVSDHPTPFDPDLDVGAGCSESCEPYADNEL